MHKEDTVGARAAAPPARSARRRALGGVLASLLIVGAGGGLVAADVLGPESGGTRELETPLAAVPAGSSVGVCPAPARLLEGAAVGTDPQFSPESGTAASVVNAAVLSSSAGAVPASRLASLDGSPLAEVAKGNSAAPAPSAPPVLLAGVVQQKEVGAETVLSADALGNQQASAGALMRYTATDGDLRGAAAAACQQPSNDLWLVGANTSLGRTAVLNLTNPSSTPATVSLDLFGAEGQIQAPGSRGLLVPPGSTRSLVLGGLAPGQDRLAVHVRSSGGPVAAFIQQSVLRGLTPGGVDFIAPSAAPAARQVMTGVDIQDPGAVRAAIGKAGYEDAGPALQLAVPGPADAVVEIRLLGRDGQKTLPDGGVVTAKGGAVTTVSLAGVPAGHYTISASADVSFVASARVTRGVNTDQPTDIAWSPATARLGSQHVVAVPQGGARFLVFGAPDDRAKITYTPITADGKLRKESVADIAGGTTTAISVPEKVEEAAVVGYVVSASGDAAYGAVELLQDGRQDIATVGIGPGAAGQEQVPVKLGF